ncbi:pentatricopeptide repeat-containing protein At1g31920 [Silene latifolia]|uniref:pentatricopeptide repeat-containing protein At1g31920 n=1 Tax=Silene latifolia TaxID=37657 RepID=UPI003D76A4D4
MIRQQIHHQAQLLLPKEDYPQKRDISIRLREQECVSLLNKCKSVAELKQVHGNVLKLGYFWNSFCVSNFISVCALSKWCNMDYASSVFNQIDDPDTFQFNTMIRGHTNNGAFQESLSLLLVMLETGILPDNFTYPFVLKVCASLSLVKLGRQIHGQVCKFGLRSDVFVQNSLINMYGKCGDIRDSCAVFQETEWKTVASWSALIASHANLGMWWECVELFWKMMEQGSCRAEESILVSLISACSHLGALDLGKSIHGYLLRNFRGLNAIIQTSLIDMYLKCGSIEEGLIVFNSMSTKNQWTYSTMISGLAIHGQGAEAILLFSEMLEKGIKPDGVLYLGVLSACRHAGLVKEGLQFFNKMRLEHQIRPEIQHYGCMIDLLGRAAMFDEAFNLIETMEMPPNDVVWRTLLSAATGHQNLEVSERVAKELVQLDSQNAGDYIKIANMYAKGQNWSDSANVRTMVSDKGLDQVPGISLVEVKRKVYTFVSQDKSNRNWEEIYEMIDEMEWQLKFEGYIPDISEVAHNVNDEEKRQRLRYHSQKLALAFALLRTPKSTVIRIVRNVRMCRDSHTYTKLISGIYVRKIVVRDRNRFHHFKDETCSCRDYW